MPITLLDGILIGIMLISALLAMVRGFSREVLSIASWVAAAFAALTFYPLLSPILAGLSPTIAETQILADGLAAAIIFLLVLIIVSYVTMLLADKIIDSRIGALDRSLGFVFGAVRGALIVIICLMGFIWLANDNEPEWVANAKSRPMLVAIGTSIRDALPSDLDQRVKGFFGEDDDKPAVGEQDAEQRT